MIDALLYAIGAILLVCAALDVRAGTFASAVVNATVGAALVAVAYLV